MLQRCMCYHEEQDNLYGKGVRVFNICSRTGKNKGYARCTVCEKLSQTEWVQETKKK